MLFINCWFRLSSSVAVLLQPTESGLPSCRRGRRESITLPEKTPFRRGELEISHDLKNFLQHLFLAIYQPKNRVGGKHLKTGENINGLNNRLT